MALITTVRKEPFGLKKLFQAREFVLLLIILLSCLILGVVSPYFLNVSNIVAVVYGLSLDIIIAIGMTYVIVSGNFDLSVGSTLALTGVIVGKMLLAGISPVVSIIVGGVILGTIVGLINGLVVSKIGINSFITTLAMMGIVRGIAFVLTEGQPVARLPQNFISIGQGKFLSIPFTFYIVLFLVVTGAIVKKKVIHPPGKF